LRHQLRRDQSHGWFVRSDLQERYSSVGVPRAARLLRSKSRSPRSTEAESLFPWSICVGVAVPWSVVPWAGRPRQSRLVRDVFQLIALPIDFSCSCRTRWLFNRCEAVHQSPDRFEVVRACEEIPDRPRSTYMDQVPRWTKAFLFDVKLQIDFLSPCCVHYQVLAVLRFAPQF
jgi:hypothetical protein